MIWVYGIAAAAGGYGALGWLFGTQAWGLRVLQAMFQVPAEALGELIGGIFDALGD